MRRGWALAAISLFVAALGPDAGAGPAPRPIPAEAAGVRIDLAGQTPVVAPGGTFAVRLSLEGIPADGSILTVVHQRVRSRSELAQSMEGDGLRTRVLQTATALATLATEADGTRRLALALDSTLRTEGVYPVELIAQDATGAPLATIVTHLIVAPTAADEAPALGVAVVAEVGATPALQPDDTIQLDRTAVSDMAEIVAGLVATADLPATLAVTPETIDALSTSGTPGDLELVEALRTAAAGREVLALPYAEVSPDALAQAGLLGELVQQRNHGRLVLTGTLEVEPTDSVWVAPARLGAEGLAALAFSGVRRLVVSDAQVAPLENGLISYSLAQPFLLAVPEDTPEDVAAPTNVEALATDPVVLDRLAGEGSPGLVASRVLSELAFLRLEQPSVARSVVLPIGPGTPASVVQLVIEGLGSGRPFALMNLDGAFEHAAPLLDRGGNQVDRRLLPVTTTPMRAADARALADARADLDTFVGLVGPDSPDSGHLGRHLLIAGASGLTGTERRGHIDSVESTIDSVANQVSTPATFTVTLTAREGTIPLTIRNDSGRPLHVSVRLRSQKLEFPDGDTIDQVLTEPSTRIDIAVRARASGAFPLEVAVTSPDGHRRLAMTRYTVRSTAVSGAGLVLSVGAGMFLIAWWASHWRRTRRSAKLVAANGHPAVGA